MEKVKFDFVIYVILLTLIQLLFLNQIIYADNIQQAYGFNSDICFKNDYEYKLLEYNFLSSKNRLIFNSFIKNSANINQNGNQNESSISQIGNFGSIVEVIQIGNENRAEVKQFANNNKVDVFQFGNNHDLSIEQWGSKGKVYIIQSGNNFENKEVKIVQF